MPSSSPPTPPPSPHAHSTPSTPSPLSATTLSRPASRHSRRPRPVVPTPVSPSVSAFLQRTGHAAHVPLFHSTGLSLPCVLSLTNAELRDDVGVPVLAHRRSLLRAFAAERAVLFAASPPGSVPEFGRILVHLSNDRTFHSWLRTAVQPAIFALALLSLAPALRRTALVRAAAAALVAAALVAQLYGALRYAFVQRTVERKREFVPDSYGVAAMLVLEVGIAVVVAYLVLAEGFVPDRPG